jgi:hypothetical protein
LPLRDVSYSFREEQRSRSSERHCVLRIAGADGSVFDRAGVQIVGEGYGLKTDKPSIVGRVTGLFSLTRLPNGKSPTLTLTQAMVGSVFPAEMLNSGPQKSDLSLLYLAYGVSEIAQLFQTIRGGDFELRFALSFGLEKIAYRVSEPLPQEILDQFNDCAGKTNIVGAPVTLQ